MRLTGALTAGDGGGAAASDACLRVSYDGDAGGVHGEVVSVLAGFLDNRPELAGVLGLPTTSPAHELVAGAYARWGSDMPTRLRGTFALLVWDGARREGLLAVDRLGAGSLVYRRSPGSLVFATEVRDLVPLLGVTPRPDERVLVRLLVDGTRETHETLLDGVHRLPGGRLLRLGPSAAEPQEYWAPSYRRPRSVDAAEAAAELREALLQAAGRACGRGAPAGILLSGGLDSNAVAAAARATGARLACYSAVFPNHPDADEGDLIASAGHELGAPVGTVAFLRGGSLAASLRYLDTWKLPPASPNLFFHEPLLQLARREGVTAVLDGQGGDELFGLSPYLAADRLRAGRVLEVRRLLRLLAPDAVPAAHSHLLREIALKGAAPAWLHRIRRRRHGAATGPDWLTAAGAELYGGGRDPWSWKEAAGPRWWAYLADAVTRGRERAGVHEFLRHAFLDGGVVGAHPLLEDADLIETVLAQPPRLAWDARHDRALLREALAGLVPDSIRLRAQKSYFNDVLGDAVHREDEAALARLLGDGAEVRRYVDPALFERLRALPPARRGRRETWLLWRLGIVECWLRMQEEPEFARTVLATWDLSESRVELVPSRAA